MQALAQIGVVEVVVALGTSDTIIGVLALGRRWDEEIFDGRDLEIIQLMAQQASLFILTDMQMRELRLVPRLVATVQESERYESRMSCTTLYSNSSVGYLSCWRLAVCSYGMLQMLRIAFLRQYGN